MEKIYRKSKSYYKLGGSVLGLLFVGIVYASTGVPVISVIASPTTAQIVVDNIKDLGIGEKIDALNKELKKSPDVETGQILLNHKTGLIAKIKRLLSGSNRHKTLNYPKYKKE